MGEEAKIELKEVLVKVAKESYEVGKAGGKFMAVIAKAIKDGWEWTDIVDIIKEVYEDAKVAAEGITSLPLEFKKEPFKASLGIVIPVAEGAEEMIEILNKIEPAKPVVLNK